MALMKPEGREEPQALANRETQIGVRACCSEAMIIVALLNEVEFSSA